MNSEEQRKENVVEGEDEEKPFFKAAFDHFDWNHSSTIPTSVRVTPFISKLKNCPSTLPSKTQKSVQG